MPGPTVAARGRVGLAPETGASEQQADALADAALTERQAPRAFRSGPSVLPFRASAGDALVAAERAVHRGGSPLPVEARRYFEPRFGFDFASVRIHTDSEAARAAEGIDARAYTLGEHIAVGANEPSWTSSVGRSLLAHELAHVVLHRASAIIHRRPKAQRKPNQPAETVVAIDADVGALEGTATLSNQQVLPLKLSRNEYPPGTYEIRRKHDRVFEKTQLIDPARPDYDPALFWTNPRVPGQDGVQYHSADTITVTIRATATYRIAQLPTEVRAMFTTDGAGPAATEQELEDLANAGEMLLGSGVTEQDLVLWDERRRAQGTQGDEATTVSAVDFATWFIEHRAEAHEAGVERSTDLVSAAKALEQEPLHMLHYGGLGAMLDADSYKEELALELQIYKNHRRSGLPDELHGLDTAGKIRRLKQLLTDFQAKLRAFEKLLVADVRAMGNAALDSAEGSVLLLDKRFVGIWQDVWPSPHVLGAELARINEDEVIVAAESKRDQAKGELASAARLELAKYERKSFWDRSIVDIATIAENEEKRDSQRKALDKEFTEVVRQNSRLKLPPGVNAQRILGTRDPDEAVNLLRDYLVAARRKIRDARSEIKKDKVLYAADVWLDEEAKRVKEALDPSLGSEIAHLIYAFSKYRRSQTSLWDDILSIVEFVSMFVPGPIGWGLRAGTAILAADKALGELHTQEALYGSGASTVAPSSGAATMAVVNAGLNLIPDASVLGKVDDAGRLAGETIEHGVAKEADDAARLGSKVDDVPPRVETETPPAVADTPAPVADKPAPVADTPAPLADTPEGATRIAGADEAATVSMDELRAQRRELAQSRAQRNQTLVAKQAEQDRLERLVEARREEGATTRLKAEDRIDELKGEIAAEQRAVDELDGKLKDVDDTVRALEGPKPPSPTPAPAAPAPSVSSSLGDLAIPSQPTTLAGTKMHSWSPNTYIATSTSGYRGNVETLLVKNKKGPLSEALLIDGPNGTKMIKPYPESVTAEVAEQNRDLFIAGHFKSRNTGDRDVIVLTSAYRNMEYAGKLENTGARMADFAYDIQGIAVEAQTAWDLVALNKLKASDLGVKIPLVR